ncbi:hypothetical protein [Geobacter sp.]|uniref:AAA family ATPase n=1 Tax=Geobacter sp. TaxID=46610 RepID=UPI00261564DC|nr:hypothetical protein [Geobacter sp.]
MKNPFCPYTLPLDAPFCNRITELKELEAFALSGSNVVLYSPRRYGKTSLVLRVQRNLAEKHGAITVFADFYGVTSIDDIAARMAKAVFAVTHRNEPLWKIALRTIRSFRVVMKPDAESGVSLSVEPASSGKYGLPLLEETMESLGEFIDQSESLVNIVLDEFQEIVELKESLQVEAAMRTRIQHQKASYFFVGSRRRILLGMFNERQRPFFQSAFNYELPALPEEELAGFVAALFDSNGKKCPREMALKLVRTVSCHPQYVQKLAYLVFEAAEKVVDETTIRDCLMRMLKMEEPFFEMMIQGLSLQQKLILRTVAIEPTTQPMAANYIAKYRLGSAGGVRHSLIQLEDLDLVEKEKTSERWRVVDPIFALYLRLKDVGMLP